jgi:protein phosphatase methylesterase 1
MGGAVAVKTLTKLRSEHKDIGCHLMGMVIIDVVEGSAIEALPYMETIILKRPPKFLNVQDVVKFGLDSGMVRDHVSARVSMPSLVVEKEDSVIKQTYFAWRTNLLSSK